MTETEVETETETETVTETETETETETDAETEAKTELETKTETETETGTELDKFLSLKDFLEEDSDLNIQISNFYWLVSSIDGKLVKIYFQCSNSFVILGYVSL